MPDLPGTLDESLKAAPWITPADAAAVALAYKLAAACEEVSSRELAPLARLLADVLDSLGLTISGRASKPEAPKAATDLDRLITAANTSPNGTTSTTRQKRKSGAPTK